MGHGSIGQNAELVVEFANIERDDSLGANISQDAEFCTMPLMKLIPDLIPPRKANPLGIDLSALQFNPMNQLNEDYFRELANYEFIRRLLRPIRLVVKNIGQVAANSVRTELTIPANMDAHVFNPSDIPDAPEQRRDLMASIGSKSVLSAVRSFPGEVTIDRNGERIRIEIDCGNLQPGRRVWSNIFYIGRGTSGNLSLNGQIFAENLPQPKDFNLTVSLKIVETKMTVSELCSLPIPEDEED
jgi:hypothetical protein